jgi:exopolyphosphatase/guanosine-5'-triphosphate,3'-diphosphate pyrophosphatase
MKIAIIDIGSNSVRLMLWSDGKTLYKRLITTRLGQGVAQTGMLCDDAITRTKNAIAQHVATALKDGAEQVFAFATEAVRASKNGSQFVGLVKDELGIEIDVLSGEEEALMGVTGAVEGTDGASVDIGGASAELTVKKHGEIVYSKSVPLGVVRLKDRAGRDKALLQKIIDEETEKYGDISHFNVPLYAIGGTATTLSAVNQRLETYMPEKVHLSTLTYTQIENLTDVFLTADVQEIKAMKGMAEGRADVIGGGSLLLLKIMQKFGVDKVIVSESDNLEGYLKRKILR